MRDRNAEAILPSWLPQHRRNRVTRVTDVMHICEGIHEPQVSFLLAPSSLGNTHPYHPILFCTGSQNCATSPLTVARTCCRTVITGPEPMNTTSATERRSWRLLSQQRAACLAPSRCRGAQVLQLSQKLGTPDLSSHTCMQESWPRSSSSLLPWHQVLDTPPANMVLLRLVVPLVLPWSGPPCAVPLLGPMRPIPLGVGVLLDWCFFSA